MSSFGSKLLLSVAALVAGRGPKVKGYPDMLVVDNGPELRGRVLGGWAHDHGLQLYVIDPGKPTQNASIGNYPPPRDCIIL
jgi:putative transposase